ncbi:MAG: thioredoxin [Amphiamblys sp. WSBS2006]|nr:MAG: thioredoxin [Amphiamblys sp. WSBS2006]
MAVQTIETMAEFEAVIKNEAPVVVDFFATWCGPCKVIGPTFELLSSKYNKVKFVKVDIEKGTEIAEKSTIRSMPTFVFYNGGVEVNRFSGSSVTSLEKHLEELS